MKHTKRKTLSPLRFLADGFVLVLLLCGTAFSFLSAFPTQVNGRVLLAVVLIFSLLFLVVFSLPRHRILALLLPAVLYGLTLYFMWDTLELGSIWVRCAVVNVFAESLSFLTPIYPIARLSSQGWQQAATLFLLVVCGPLSCLLAWAVVRLRSFWLSFWITAPIIAAPLVITKTPDWLPLMAVVACWAVLLLASLATKRDPEGGARLTLICLPMVGILLVLLTFALPRESYRQPVWASSAQTKLVSFASSIKHMVPLPGGALPGPFGGFMAAAGSESVNLAAAGPLRYTGGTVLRVQTDVTGKLYLRGYSAAVYTDTGWEGLPDEAYQLAEANRLTSSSFVPGWDARHPLNLPSMALPNKGFKAITIENVAAPDGCVYFPYQLFTTPDQVAGAAFTHDAYLARAWNVRKHTLYFKPELIGEDGPDYTPLVREPSQAEEAYRDFVYQNYLDIPSAVAADGLARWLSSLQDLPGVQTHNIEGKGYPDSVENALFFAQLIGIYLDQTTKYSLTTPATPPEKDFVSYFLNESRQGYCMHYASAATLLFRWYGVPARYVSGYVTSVPAAGVVNVPDYAAHAWTEIYLDGYGWYPVDTTPGYEGRALPWQTEDSVVPTPTPSAKPSATPKPTLAPTTAPTPTPSAGAIGGGTDSSDGAYLLRLLWIPAVPLLLAAALLLRRTLARRGRETCFSGPNPNQSVLAAYGYLQRLLPWGAEASPEIEALAQKAKFSQHTLTPQEWETVVSYVRTQAGKTDDALTAPKRLILRYLLGLY